MADQPSQNNQSQIQTVRSETYDELHFEVRVSLKEGIIFMLTNGDERPFWLVGMDPSEAHAISEALQVGIQEYMKLKKDAEPKRGVPCQ